MIDITVNGQRQRLDCLPATRLSHVLREGLGLTGTKIGCDAGDCGACTVLLDDQQVCACLVPVAQADGQSVVTVEGLAADPTTARLQQAFLELGAAQCGICTPGMLMAATDLLKRNALPSADEVRDALGGVLCRCTGYVKIVEAVLACAQPPAVEPSRAVATEGINACRGSVGDRLPKVDGQRKVDGSDRFGADVVPAGCLTLRALRSPHAHARFRFGDLAAFARAHPDIRLLTAADVPGNNRFGIFARYRDQPVFADGYVRYRGEAIAALVGPAEAIEALPDTAVPLDWSPLPALHGIDAALTAEATQLHPHAPGNVLLQGRQRCGDAARALADAPFTATMQVETGFVEHAYIEPEAGYAIRQGDRIELFVSTQTPYMDRDEVAWVLGIEQTRVRIIPSAVGGGFGGKIDMAVQPLIAVAAWLLNRPVRCTYSRNESMAATTKRHPARIDARLGCTADGKLTGFDFQADFNTGPYASCGPIVANRVPIHAMGPYRVPAVHCRTRAIHTNDSIAGAFRGFGVPQAAIVHEALMDDLADQTGMDRLAFRLHNALAAGDRTATGQRMGEDIGMRACLEALRADWEAESAACATFNRENHEQRRGVGVGCMWYGIGNTSQPNPSSMRIGLTRDGRYRLFCGAVDIGQGASTILMQICADSLGVPIRSIDLISGDTDLTLDAGKSSASRQTFISGNAVRAAADDLLSKVAALGTADLSKLPLVEADLVAIGSGRYDPPTTDLDDNDQGSPYASYAFAAQIATVEVDLRLGTVNVRRVVAAHDVGRAINPTQVEGQIHGGIMQGLGLALMEEYLPGRTENLHDYLIPTVGDVPDIKIILIELGDPGGPFGAKGIGEPALVPTAPAILGGIRHATGIQARRVPVTPDRLWRALQAGR